MPLLTEVFLLTESQGYDEFPQTESDFTKRVDYWCRKLYGNRYKQEIDGSQGWSGATDKAIKQLWDGLWTVNEAIGEVGFLYENATNGVNPASYGGSAVVSKGGGAGNFGPREDIDVSGSNGFKMVPRTSRPKSPQFWNAGGSQAQSDQDDQDFEEL